MIIKKENIKPFIKISSFRKALKLIVYFTFIINIIVIILVGVFLKSYPSYFQIGVNKIKSLREQKPKDGIGFTEEELLKIK